MFWKKKKEAEHLPKPQDIPEPVGRFLVVGLRQDPNWVWRLKSVVRPHSENNNLFDIRVFDGAKVTQSDLKITNFNSFDGRRDLILYEGWFNRNTFQVQVMDPNQKPGSLSTATPDYVE